MQQATSKLIRAAMEDLDVEPKKKPARATAQKDTTKKAATDHAATAKNNAKATAKHGKSGFKNQREDSEEQKSDVTAEDSDEVDFDDKVRFTENVRKLDNDGLSKLVKKVGAL